MASLGMVGPFSFNKEMIESLLGDNVIGNYALGYLNHSTNTFIVLYIGRSDKDLKKRLISHLDDKEQYKDFKFIKQNTIQNAYLCECKNYHDFGGDKGSLVNNNHPAKPETLAIRCPYCGK